MITPSPRRRAVSPASFLTGCVTVLTLLSLAVTPRTVAAQHTGGAQPMVTRAPAEASQFDFLVGQWNLVVEPQLSTLAARVHGTPKLAGSWKAWRALDGWGVEDELRIVDPSGNPMSLSLFVRAYDVAAKKWRVSSTEAYTAATSQSLATWRGSEMEMVAAGPRPDSEGRTYVGRSRMTDVTPTSFQYVQERSYDGGQSWEATLKVQATRVAATAPR